MRVNVENYRLVDDTLLGPCHFVSQNVDIVSDFPCEVKALLPWDLLEDPPRLRILILKMIQSKL